MSDSIRQWADLYEDPSSEEFVYGEIAEFVYGLSDNHKDTLNLEELTEYGLYYFDALNEAYFYVYMFGWSAADRLGLPIRSQLDDDLEMDMNSPRIRELTEALSFVVSEHDPYCVYDAADFSMPNMDAAAKRRYEIYANYGADPEKLEVVFDIIKGIENIAAGAYCKLYI